MNYGYDFWRCFSYLSEMEDLAQRLCWEQVGKNGQTAIWHKPTNDVCYKSRPPGTNPPFCDEGDDPDQVW